MLIFALIIIINNFKKKINVFIWKKLYHYYFNLFTLFNIKNWGLGIGDWGLGIGGLAQYPQPQTPNPKPQPPNPNFLINM